MQLPKLNASIGLGNPAKKKQVQTNRDKRGEGGGTVLKMLDLVSILLFIAIILSYLYQYINFLTKGCINSCIIGKKSFVGTCFMLK